MKYTRIHGEVTQIKNDNCRFVIIGYETYFTNDEYVDKMWRQRKMAEAETREEIEKKLAELKEEYKDSYEYGHGRDFEIVEIKED